MKLIDLSNTQQFQKLVQDFGHPPSKRYMVAAHVDVLHEPNWFVLHSCKDWRNMLIVELLESEGWTFLDNMMVQSAPVRFKLDWPLPARWLGSMSEAHSTIARINMKDKKIGK